MLFSMADGQDRICEGYARRLRSLAANFLVHWRTQSLSRD
jgi:hypothetical protein